MALAVLGSCGPMVVGNRWARVAGPALDSVVMVELYDGDLRYGHGSGAIVRADGYVVTNAHVVDGTTFDGLPLDIWVKFRDGRRFLAAVVYVDRCIDIAVIQCNFNGEQPLKFSTGGPRVGQEVLTIGHARMLEWTVSAGIVSALRGDEGDGGVWMQTTSAVNPGCSGGPVLDARGQIVGITVAYSPQMEQVYWAIPAFEVLHAIGPVAELHLIDVPFEPQGGG